jgi:hypothetical protein
MLLTILGGPGRNQITDPMISKQVPCPAYLTINAGDINAERRHGWPLGYQASIGAEG